MATWGTRKEVLMRKPNKEKWSYFCAKDLEGSPFWEHFFTPNMVNWSTPGGQKVISQGTTKKSRMWIKHSWNRTMLQPQKKVTFISLSVPRNSFVWSWPTQPQHQSWSKCHVVRNPHLETNERVNLSPSRFPSLHQNKENMSTWKSPWSLQCK